MPMNKPKLSIYGDVGYGKSWYDIGTVDRFDYIYQHVQQHQYKMGEGQFDLTKPCRTCGRGLLTMIKDSSQNPKYLLHSNVNVNLEARNGEPMNYGITAYVDRDAGISDFDDEEEVYRPDKKGRTMAFQQFTQLLQRARQDHNLLDQDEVWVNTHGLKVLLKDMSARYASNVLAYLRKNGRAYHSSWATWEFITKYTDQDAESWEEILEESITDAKVRTWLKDTKLYKALTAIAKNSV